MTWLEFQIEEIEWLSISIIPMWKISITCDILLFHNYSGDRVLFIVWATLSFETRRSDYMGDQIFGIIDWLTSIARLICSTKIDPCEDCLKIEYRGV